MWVIFAYMLAQSGIRSQTGRKEKKGAAVSSPPGYYSLACIPESCIGLERRENVVHRTLYDHNPEKVAVQVEWTGE